MSVGPNANMVIDQFVYDPNAGTGKLAASVSRGIFRFVGGKISKQENAVTMRTPAATIGIRGGVMLVDQAANGRLEAIFVFGKGLTVTGLNGVSKTVFRPGFEVTVGRPGDTPSDPAPAPPGRIAGLLAQLDGRAGGNGGAPIVPTDVMVVNSGVDNSISATASLNSYEAPRLRSPEPVPATTFQASADTARLAPIIPPTTVSATTEPTPAQMQVAIAAPPTPVVTQPSPAPVVTQPLPPVVIQTLPPVVIQTLPPVVAPTPQPVVTPAPQPVVTPSSQPVATVTNSTGGSGGGTGTGGTGGGTGTGGGAGTGTPVTLTGVAGGYLDTGNQGVAKGFTSMLWTYADAKTVNGDFVATLSNGKKIQFPLVAGTATLSPAGTGTMSPLGAVTGTTYVAADGSFFYANLTPLKQPAQREFIYGGTPIDPTNAKTPGYLAFNVQPDAALRSSIPFIRLQAGGSLVSPEMVSEHVSPLILATPLNTTFGTDYGGTKALQASLAVVGSGSNQQSVIVVLVGNVCCNTLSSADLTGTIHGSYMASANSQPVRINTDFETPLDGAQKRFYGSSSNSISGFVLTPGATAANATEVNTATQATETYRFAQPVTATPVPPAVATATQTSQTLKGWFGGIMTKEAPGGAGTPLPYAVAGKASITTSTSFPSFPTNVSSLQITATLSGGDPFTSAASGVPTPKQKGIVLQFGSLGGPIGRQAFINDHLFATFEGLDNSTVAGGTAKFSADPATGTNPNIYLATQTAAPSPTSLLPNGLCSSCQYLQWGYWGGQIDTQAIAGGPVRTDVGHINFWVAGPQDKITSALDIASLASSSVTATYSGNMIGTVQNGAAQYIASGALTAQYNFAKANGFFTANYDAVNIKNVPFTATTNGSNYSFGLTNGAVNGKVHGTFFGGMASETGGNFAFTAGPAYTTSGIFAAIKH